MIFNLYTLFLLISSAAVSLGGTYLNRNDLPLSSKVIFQSPMMENVYKEILLSSKPINLKKYATAKPKNSQKDSKIYYIPIGPMPYHFSHAAGYDSQPVKVNPLIKVNKQPPTNPILNGPNVPPNLLQAFLQNFQQNQQNFQQKVPQIVPQSVQPNYTPVNINPNKAQIVPQNLPHNAVAPNSQQAPAVVGLANTKLTRLNGHAYYFNGRPFRLKAYRAAPKLNVDKYNLNSHLFFNKNIIY